MELQTRQTVTMSDEQIVGYIGNTTSKPLKKPIL